MKISLKIVFCLLVIISFKLRASNFSYKMDTHFVVSDNKIEVPGHLNYMTYQLKGSWTDNYGNYGTTSCRGIVKTDDLNKIDLEIMCEGSDKNDYKNWSMTKRVSDNFEQGVGLSEYMEGTGVWKRLKGLKCNYATSYKNNVSFTLEKCKISEEQHKFLSRNE